MGARTVDGSMQALVTVGLLFPLNVVFLHSTHVVKMQFRAGA